jgi:hypothetical protein
MCEAGATNLDLAHEFQVSVQTVRSWRHRHPEFRAALKIGKDVADEIVARSLFERATGYSHDAVKVFMPAGADKPVYAPYVEHVPPDATSMIFWLKNRKPDEWRDKTEVNLQVVDIAAALEAGRKRVQAKD